MPLPLTTLDDRRWADLVDEGTALIPRYAPLWTDHNIHDPGITLIELFAWLSEMTLYRLNRVPPRHRRKFLALIGFTAMPPRAAQTVLSCSPDANTTAFDLPAGVLFDATGRDGQTLAFSTTRDVRVSVVTLVAIQVDDGDTVIHDRTADWRDGLGVTVFGPNPIAGAALYFGFRDLPAQEPIALAVRLAGPGNDREERARIIREAAEQTEACRHVLPDIDCGKNGVAVGRAPDSLPAHHSARVVWEVFTGIATSPWQTLESVAMPARPQIGQVVDDTRSLTLDGLVEVNLPLPIAPEVSTKLFQLRCRLVTGGYDAPPVLLDVAPNSVAAEQSVPISRSFTIAAGVNPQGTPPPPGQSARLQMQLDGNGVITGLTFLPAGTSGAPDLMLLSYTAPTATPGEITLELLRVGLGSGRPLAPIAIPAAPVSAESFDLYTHSGSTWQEWIRRDDLDASTRIDFHFVLDATNGEVTFGDGEHGRVPAANELILAVYRTTRAVLGNVAANAATGPSDTLRNRVLLSPLQPAQRSQLSHVTNPAAATGGAAEEDLAAVTGRAVETLHAHDRLVDLVNDRNSHTLDQLDKSDVLAIRPPTNAVNVLDIERLALAVPGTRVARARACAAIHPNYPCLDAPGVVTVVILPEMPVPRPEPAAGLLDAVKRYLDRRRMVCTRLEVIGPQYLDVNVSASVQLKAGANAARVKAAIVRALNAFLDPRTGGPNGRGWPFGRAVFRTDVLQLIAAVHGVDHVLSLSLRAGAGEPQCSDLPVCPTWLVAPGTMQIDVPSATARPRGRQHIPPCPPTENRKRNA